MNISFYQVPVGFNPNFTYLGDLEEKHSEDVNVDLKLLEYVDIPLYSSNTKYNYIRITDGDLKYYYSLYSLEYMNYNQHRIKYKLDVIRTLKESSGLNYEILTSQFSEMMNMSEEQKNYFIRNQPFKLSGNILDSKHKIGFNYSTDELTNEYWKNMKWIYVWLQPREPQILEDGYPWLYSVKQSFTKVPSGTIHSTRPPSGPSVYNVLTPEQGWIPAWGAMAIPGTVWVTQLPGSTTYEYYKVHEQVIYQQRIRTYKQFDSPHEDVVIMDYVNSLPRVTNLDLPNNLYCLVFPSYDVLLRTKGTPSGSSPAKIWSPSILFDNVFNVNQDDNWLPFIVDIKISDMPPFDNVPELIKPSTDTTPFQMDYYHPNFMTHIQGVNFRRKTSGNINAEEIPEKPIWGIKTKINKPVKMSFSGFEIPLSVTKDLLKEKYYLSVFENRVELDLALLINDKARTLYFYEDIQPGRTNYILGFAPEGSNEDVLYYLSHSPSVLNISRDSSLPVFTSNYSEYIANNKNFIAQAELTRNTQLMGSLINSGSNALGAAATGITVSNFNPALAIAGAAGGVAAALIKRNAEEKQFNWMVDNVKSAPGNYKNANATTSLLLTLEMSKPWIEKYTSNQFDLNLYYHLIDNVGYNYFDFPYNLNELISTVEMVGKNKRKYLQGVVTGIAFSEMADAYLVHLLHKYLAEGVNIYT